MADLNNVDFLRILHGSIRHRDEDDEVERARAFFYAIVERGREWKNVTTFTQHRLYEVLAKYASENRQQPSLTILTERLEENPKSIELLTLLDEYKVLLGAGAFPTTPVYSALDAAGLFKVMAETYRDHAADTQIRLAHSIVNGRTGDVRATRNDPDREDRKGWREAFTHLRREMAAPVFRVGATLPEGVWQENAIARGESFLDRLSNLSKTRCYTGFSAIDDAVMIGPSEENRYIGVCAYTNHGKTTYLTTLAYNLSLQGKKVLFVALEDGVEGMWDKLTFLHAYYRPDLDIPGGHIWKHNFASITEKQKDDFRELTASVKEEMKGKLDIRDISRWSDIVAHLEAEIEPYDACIVDYFGRLDTGLVGDKEQAEMRNIFKMGQLLTQTYRDNRGLLLVTGLQTNRKGMEAAAKNEGDPGTYTDLNCINYFSSAAQDMRLILTVWGGDDFLSQNLLKVGCLKVKGTKFATHNVRIDPRTRMLTEDTPWAKTMPVTTTWKGGPDLPRDYDGGADSCADLSI